MAPLTKSANALRTIREVANELSLEPHVLRFWESEFPQLKPTKLQAGRRYYRAEDIALLKQIQNLLHDQGYTIKGARAMLKQKVSPAVKEEVQDSALHDQLKQLHTKLSQLRSDIASAL